MLDSSIMSHDNLMRTEEPTPIRVNAKINNRIRDRAQYMHQPKEKKRQFCIV